MQIQVDSENFRVEATLPELLEALESVTRDDAEIAAVLVCMLDEGRLRFVGEVPLAA